MSTRSVELRRELRGDYRILYRETKPERAAKRHATTLSPVLSQNGEEEMTAREVDWQVRMVYQDGRFREVQTESRRRNLSVPVEWKRWAERRARGFPKPPPDLK